MQLGILSPVVVAHDVVTLSTLIGGTAVVGRVQTDGLPVSGQEESDVLALPLVVGGKDGTVAGLQSEESV